MQRKPTLRHQRTQEGAEAAQLEQLRARLKAEGLTLSPEMVVAGDEDATLLRFLRARKHVVEDAYGQLAASLKWRAEMGADAALATPLDPALKKICRTCRPSSYVAFDRQHRPVFVERLGLIDPHRIEELGLTVEQLLLYHLREMEFMAQVVFAEATAATGHTVDKVITVIDASHLRLGALTGVAQRIFRALMAMDSNNYPECCAAIYIVNTGAVFNAIWRVVQGFVDRGTRDKIHVMGSGRAMEKALLEVFDPAMLPTFLGGSLDYDTVRGEWAGRMDAAMEAAAAAARRTPPHQQADGGADGGASPPGGSPRAAAALPKHLHAGSAASGSPRSSGISPAGFDSFRSLSSTYFDARQSFSGEFASHSDGGGGPPGTPLGKAAAADGFNDADHHAHAKPLPPGGAADVEQSSGGVHGKPAPACGCCVIS